MTPSETLTLAAYFFVLIILAVYGWHRYYLVYLYMRNRDKDPRPMAPLNPLPAVTIQLPLYNEMYVADRLIDAVCGIEYPRELLEIQVLDDSTDETRTIAESAVRRFAAEGIDIRYIHRADRTGYKAGALEAGLQVARGEFVAIFDADFIPRPDFLTQLMPHFADPKVAMVQARWGHINQDYSLLTKIQSILLDGHFVLEHGGRYRAGRFFNFNGTAGIWRRAAIEDAGGWQHDTLTEDLDLSYRAQLRGWHALVFLFLGVLFGGLFAVANGLLGPRRPNPIKEQPYESGIPSNVPQNFRFGISFYLIAMLFILFDIEVVFLYPVAVQLEAFGTFALVETIVFIVLLFVAFIYVWRRGALEWK